MSHARARLFYHMNNFNNIHTIQRKEMTLRNLPLKMKFQQSTNFLMYQIILVAEMMINNRCISIAIFATNLYSRS